MVQLLWKTISQFLKKLNMQVPYDPAVAFMDVYSREIKVYVHTKTYTYINFYS